MVDIINGFLYKIFMLENMTLSSPFRKAAIYIGLKKASDKELMLSAFEALQDSVTREMNFGAHPWMTKYFPSKLKPLIMIEIELLQNNQDHLIAKVQMTNTLTDIFDDFDFKISIQDDALRSTDDSACSDYQDKATNRHVRIDMPHHPHPRFITHSIDRMEFVGFILSEAEDQVGLDASLRMNGIKPPPKDPADPFKLG